MEGDKFLLICALLFFVLAAVAYKATEGFLNPAFVQTFGSGLVCLWGHWLMNREI